MAGSGEAGNLVVYEIRSDGECLWGRAYSAYEGQAAGESFDMMLFGTLKSDFTAEVDLLELSVGNPLFYPHFGRAAVTLAIRFDVAPVALEITALQARPHGGESGGFGEDSLFPIGGPTIGDVLSRSP